MSLTADEVKTVAHLARLALNDEDLKQYASELSSILELVDQLEKAPTEGVIPMAHPLEVVQRLRADEISETDQRDRFQSVAPSTAEGHYLVPRVIE